MLVNIHTSTHNIGFCLQHEGHPSSQNDCLKKIQSHPQDWLVPPRFFARPDRDDDQASDSVVITATALLDGFEENPSALPWNSRVVNLEGGSVDGPVAGHVYFSLSEPAEYGGSGVADACVRVALLRKR